MGATIAAQFLFGRFGADLDTGIESFLHFRFNELAARMFDTLGYRRGDVGTGTL